MNIVVPTVYPTVCMKVVQVSGRGEVECSTAASRGRHDQNWSKTDGKNRWTHHPRKKPVETGVRDCAEQASIGTENAYLQHATREDYSPEPADAVHDPHTPMQEPVHILLRLFLDGNEVERHPARGAEEGRQLRVVGLGVLAESRTERAGQKCHFAGCERLPFTRLWRLTM
jgi:hypothetical protein